MKPVTLKDSVLATLCYADIFEFPLSREEMRMYLIGREADMNKVSRVLANSAVIGMERKTGWYYLFGHKKFVRKRTRRAECLSGKWSLIKKFSRVLQNIPTVCLIGVTGGLAFNNTDADDDIDVFIIVREGTVFITRLIAVFLTEIAFKRRRPGSKKLKDTICLNMFVAHNHLQVPDNDRNLYIAHEIMHLSPVYNKNSIYKKYIIANSWVREYLPNAWKGMKLSAGGISQDKSGKWLLFIDEVTVQLMKILEKPAKFVQVCYMAKRRTREVVSDTVLKFHPVDRKALIAKEFSSRLKKLNVPLDKFSFAHIK